MGDAMWQIVLEIAPALLAGLLVAAGLHVLLPTNWLAGQFRGRWGVVRAVLLGVPLPLCSCSVIPVGLSLRNQGASRGAIVAFLISTPQTGVDSVLVSGAMLGWPFALLKVLAATVMGLLGGWLADAVERPLRPALPIMGHGQTRKSHWSARMASYAHMLLGTLWWWLVVGIVASAAISQFIPTEWLAIAAGYGGFPAMLAALAISVPLYVCATASVPVAAALVAGGFPAGAALVFLMAGPATNVATLGAVYQTLGRRSLVIYLATITAGSLIAGSLFSSAIDGLTFHSRHPHHETVWWREAMGYALLLWMVLCAAEWLVRYGIASRSRPAGSGVEPR